MTIRKRDDSNELEFNFDVNYLHDCLRLKGILESKGYQVDSLDDCYNLWDRYSNTMAAGWMMMGDEGDEEVFGYISYYLND